MRRYLITIKSAGRTVCRFECMADSSITATIQHACLIPPEGGYVVASPVGDSK